MSLTCFKEEKRYVPRVIDPNGFNKVVPFNYMIKKVKKLNGSNFKSRSDKDDMQKKNTCHKEKNYEVEFQNNLTLKDENKKNKIKMSKQNISS